jgi:hypothetical protein
MIKQKPLTLALSRRERARVRGIFKKSADLKGHH